MKHFLPHNLLTLAPLLLAAAAVALAGARAQGLLGNTALVAAGALAAALPLGGLLAVLVGKVDTLGRRAATVILLAMLFIPLHLHAAAWRAGFGGLGWFTQLSAGDGPVDPLLSGAAGAIWVHATAAIAWVALIVGAALRGVDPRLEEDSLLFFSAPRVLWRVSLRCAAGAFVVATGWVLVIAAHEMAASDLFQVRTFAEEVYTQHALGLFDPGQSPSEDQRMQAIQLALGLSAVWGVAVAVLWGVGGWLSHAKDQPKGKPWLWKPTKGRASSSVALWLLLLLVAGMPIGNLVFKAGGRAVRDGDSWRREWSAGKVVSQLAAAPVRHRRELGQSAKLGACVATGAVLVGGAIAWRLVRGGPERLVWLALLAACLTTPGPLIGIGAIRIFNQPSDSPCWFLSWAYDHTLLVTWLVQMIRATPIAALVLWPVWRSLPRNVLDAAALDGAARWLVAARMRLPAVASVWLIALAISFAELSATLLVMPPGDQTITLQLFNLLHSGVDDRVAAISLWMIGLLVVVSWGVLRLGTAARGAVTR